MTGQPHGVHVSERDGVVVATVSGEIDVATAPHILERLQAALPYEGRMVVDLSDVPFADSAGIRVLDRMAGHAEEFGVGVRFVVPPASQLRYLLRITAFPDAALSADLQSALADGS